MGWIRKVLLLAFFAAVAVSADDVSARRMAWAHYVGWTVPDQISLQPANFYSFPAYERGEKPYADEVHRAIDAGLDGFFVDVSVQYKWRPGFYYTVENLLKGAEGTSFRVAPCLDVKTDVSNQIDHVCWMLSRFGNHPNYPRVGDRYVIATYTYHEWKPEEWRVMLDGCAKKGFPIYMVANVKPSCGVLLPDRLERYRDVFDACYSFAYTGRERLTVADEDRGVAEWCARNGKLFMPCIHPGYLAAWLRGSNPGYIPFQGVDAQMRCFDSARVAGGQWLHFTSWNDHCETTLEPMLLTPGNKHLMRAMADEFKRLPPAAEQADILFAYHREELPGTLLRFEALRLPSKEKEPVEVSGMLHDADGRGVFFLPSKTLTSAWDRVEWLVPSGELARSPHLTPRFTMNTRTVGRSAVFPALYFRTPWIENPITIRATFADRANVSARLEVAWKNGRMVRGHSYGGRVSAQLAFTNSVPVKRAILFKNDRPVGQFAVEPPVDDVAALPLAFSGQCRFEASFPSGRVRMAMRKGNPPGRDGFSWDEHGIRNRPHVPYQDMMSAWLEGPPDAEFVLATGGSTNRFTLPELACRRYVAVDGGKLELKVHSDCTLREMPMLDRKQGVFHLELYDRFPGTGAAYFARLEFADGRICETETIYPFCDGGCVPMPVLETPVTLETYPGDLSLPRIEPLVTYREFLTPPENLPLRESVVRNRRVARASLRYAWWPLMNSDCVGTYDDRMVMDLKPEYFITGSDGLTSLSFSGKEQVRLPLREWPMDTALVEFEMAPSDAEGKVRSVIYRKGYGAAFTVRQLGDNRLEVTWSGVGKGGVWKVETAEKASVVSSVPVVPGRWTEVQLVNDHRRLRMFLNGRLDAEVPFRTFRCFAPVTIVLGGGEEKLSGYRGLIRNVKIGPCPSIGVAVETRLLSPDGENDMTSQFLSAIDDVRMADGGVVRLTSGTYHFRSPSAMRFYVSNHDNPMPRNVFLPLTNLTDVAVEGENVDFVFHGEGMGVLLQDCRRTSMRGIRFDYATPWFVETRFETFDGGRPVVACAPPQFSLAVENARLVSLGESWKGKPRLLGVFAADTGVFRGWRWIGGNATALGGNRFRIEDDWSSLGFVSAMSPGDIVQVRDAFRPNPTIFLNRSVDTSIRDCVIHSSAGIGVMAQRSENVTVCGSGRAEDRRAGSFAKAGCGRLTALQADATHFSNCRGTVTVENCLFEGMSDDAINVHSTCLKIESLPDPRTIVCRYKHAQSVGFEVFEVGETLRFIKARTLEDVERTAKVCAVRMKSFDTVELTLDGAVPAEIGVGDAVENADWHPTVVFRRNLVRNSTPRAALFTTSGRVLCESNRFEHVAGQPIHIEADACNWYESGGCRDVTIRGNMFHDCMRVSGKGVIQITPNVKDIEGQKVRYHRNIVIEENEFCHSPVPLLYARSASNVVWRANRVTDTLGQAITGRIVSDKSQFDIKHCEAVKID